MPLRWNESQKISPSRLLGPVPGLKFIQVHPNALGGLNLIQLYPKAFETHSNVFFEGGMGWELGCWLVMYIYVMLMHVAPLKPSLQENEKMGKDYDYQFERS